MILPLQDLQGEHKPVLCPLDPLLKFLRPQVLDKFIRIFIGIHPDNLCRDSCFSQDRNCPERCLRPCLIAVIGQVHLLDITPDQGSMPRGQRGTQGSHRIGKAGLMHRNHIHIAFTEQKIGLPRGPGTVQPVQIPAFVKNGGLRGIQILGLRISHDASSESDHPAVHIHDRKHDTVPELVINTMLFVDADEARLADHLLRISL